ncbi:MAG TPA: PASTA domain-containing protein [Acidobacteriaceae bacterium]|jgi:beta-lactam-binding protein with PASTA domain|nr:PASTA domain-containing protein [Acidobacteriaceae bacterium]
MKPRIRFFRLGMYLLLLTAVALVSTAITMRFAIHGAEVSVPDLSNLTVTEARQRALSAHLSTNVDGRYYSNDVPVGHVLTQIPAAGTVVRRGWRVRVSESLGPRKVPIPDVVGQPERISSIRIRRLGLELGSVAHLPFQSENPGAVLAQDPPASSSDVSRPRVSILIADSPDDTEISYVMPDFVGQMQATAEDAIQRAGLHLAGPPQLPASAASPVASAAVAPLYSGNANNVPTTALATTTVPSVGAVNDAAQHPPTVPAGTITAQFPAAGSRVDAQTSIRLTIAQ